MEWGEIQRFLQKYPLVEKYTKFFVVGGSGVFLNLAITWMLTEFFFGLENYFYAYLVGTAVNLIYNFALHTLTVFKTRSKHAQRFTLFVTYSLAMTALQAFIVNRTVSFFGEEFYLLIIATIIFVFSIVSFVVFNYGIFRKRD